MSSTTFRVTSFRIIFLELYFTNNKAIVDYKDVNFAGIPEIGATKYSSLWNCIYANDPLLNYTIIGSDEDIQHFEKINDVLSKSIY